MVHCFRAIQRLLWDVGFHCGQNPLLGSKPQPLQGRNIGSENKIAPSTQKKHTFFAFRHTFLPLHALRSPTTSKISVSTISFSFCLRQSRFLWCLWSDFAKAFYVFDVSKMIQDTAPARYSVPAPGVKLKLRPRDGTMDRCCPSTLHVLRGEEVIGSNFVVWRCKIANCWLKRKLNRCLGKLRTNHRLKCLMDKQI